MGVRDTCARLWEEGLGSPGAMTTAGWQPMTTPAKGQLLSEQGRDSGVDRTAGCANLRPLLRHLHWLPMATKVWSLLCLEWHSDPRGCN